MKKRNQIKEKKKREKKRKCNEKYKAYLNEMMKIVKSFFFLFFPKL